MKPQDGPKDPLVELMDASAKLPPEPTDMLTRDWIAQNESQEYICAECGKDFYVGEQLFLDESLTHSRAGWFHKDCEPKQRLEAKKAEIRAIIYKIATEWYDYGREDWIENGEWADTDVTIDSRDMKDVDGAVAKVLDVAGFVVSTVNKEEHE